MRLSKLAPRVSPEKGPGRAPQPQPAEHGRTRCFGCWKTPVNPSAGLPVCPPPHAPVRLPEDPGAQGGPGPGRRRRTPPPLGPRARGRLYRSAGVGASLRLTYRLPPQARVPRSRDNGTSTANTLRVSIRGCLPPTLARLRDRGGETDGWECRERRPRRLCVPCVPCVGLRARSGRRGPPGPGRADRQRSRDTCGRGGGGKERVAGLPGPGRWRGWWGGWAVDPRDGCTWNPKAAARGQGPGMTILAERPAFAVNARELPAQRPLPGARRGPDPGPGSGGTPRHALLQASAHLSDAAAGPGPGTPPLAGETATPAALAPPAPAPLRSPLRRDH